MYMGIALSSGSSGVVPQGRIILSLLQKPLLTALLLRLGSGELLIYAGILSGLILCSSSAGNHNDCEFKVQ